MTRTMFAGIGLVQSRCVATCAGCCGSSRVSASSFRTAAWLAAEDVEFARRGSLCTITTSSIVR